MLGMGGVRRLSMGAGCEKVATATQPRRHSQVPEQDHLGSWNDD